MQESIVFLVCVQCRRKESSRSLSHLLMSFLLLLLQGRYRYRIVAVWLSDETRVNQVIVRRAHLLTTPEAAS